MIVEIDGLQSIVEQRGRERDAPPTVVLLPSMLIRPRSYTRLVQRLSETYRVITLEAPGTGRASKLPRPWTFHDYAHHLLRVLESLELREAILIGHSNSAAVAMLAAGSEDPAARRIGRIVLADSVGLDPRHGFWRIGLGRLLDGVFEAGFSITALADVFWNLFVHTKNFLCEIEQAIHWDAAAHAPRVRQPTLIAWGQRDITFLPWCAHRLQAMIPQAQLHLCRTGHHDWLETNAGEFAAAVEAFCLAHPPWNSDDNDPDGLYGER